MRPVRLRPFHPFRPSSRPAHSRGLAAALVIVLAVTTLAANATAELLYGAEGNRLRRYDIDTIGGSGHLVEEVLVRNATEGETGSPDLNRGRDINGTVCPFPDGSGRFVAGEDTGQPNPTAGYGIFRADGTQIGKLTPTYVHTSPEPFGCAFAANGTLFTTSVGTQGLNTTRNGQLILWFPPFDGYPGAPGEYPDQNPISDNFCKIATDIGTAGEVAIDSAGNVYVAASGQLNVIRFSPPFPTGPDAAGGCGNVDATGAPLATSVNRQGFVGLADGLATYSGLEVVGQGASERLIASSVLEGKIAEFDLAGNFIRYLLDHAVAFQDLPKPFGNPQGITVDAQGTLYYADLDLVGGLPNPAPGPNGKVRRITFDANGDPNPPEIVREGLAFPDSVAVLPGDLEATEWRTYAGGPERRFFQPAESIITSQNVGQLAIRWRHLSTAVITDSPSVAQVDVPGHGLIRVVYFTSWDRNVYALRYSDGMELWRFATDEQPGASFPNAASVHVARLDDRDVVFVGSGEKMYALDAATGSLDWTFTAGTGCVDAQGDPPGLCGFGSERNQIESSAYVVDGRLFFGMDVNDVATGKGGFFALDARAGTLDWFFDLETGATCRPDPGDAIRAFDGYHGEAELGLPTGFFATRSGCDFDRTPTGCGNVWSSPAVDLDRGLLITASSNCDTPFDAGLGDYLPMPPYDEAIFALDFDGAPAWRWRPREVDPDDLAFGAVPNLFTIDDAGMPRDVAGVGNKDGTYYVVDRDTGELVWSTNVVPGGDIGGVIATASVDVDRARIFFSTAPGESSTNSPPGDPVQQPTMHALDLHTGAIVWDNAGEMPLPQASFSPTSGIPGLAFTGTVFGGVLRGYDTENDAGVLAGSFNLGNFGLASGATFIDGTILVGAGIGTLTQTGSSPGDFTAAVDSLLTALCVPGTSGCGACNDGVDNDGDGLVDFAGGDPGCVSDRDDSEVLGDLDFDGDVDQRDTSLVIGAFGRSRNQTSYIDAADFDRDQTVTLVDYQTFLQARDAWEASQSPGCGLVGLEALLVAGAVRMTRRRSRRRTRTRRGVGLLAGVIACGWIAFGATDARADARIRVVPEASVVSLGETFSVEIRADFDTGVVGWGLDLELDPSLSTSVAPSIAPPFVGSFAPDGDGLAGLAPGAPVVGTDLLLATLLVGADGLGLASLMPAITAGDLAEGIALSGAGFDVVSFVGASVQVVPEPGTALLLGLGLVSFAMRGRRHLR